MASEQSEKKRDKGTSDLCSQDSTVDALHVENVKEVKEVEQSSRQLFINSLELSVNGDTQTVDSLKLSDSLHHEQHPSSSWPFEGDGEVCLPIQIKVPDSSIVQSFASVADVSSGSVSDIVEEDILNNHIDHKTIGFSPSPQESGKEELHLFYADDQSITTVPKVLNGISELCSQASYLGSHQMSAATSSNTVELLPEDHRLLTSGYFGLIYNHLFTFHPSSVPPNSFILFSGES